MQQQASIIISAGRSCFVKCAGCYNFFGKNEALTKSSIIIDFLACAKQLGVAKVTIGGGDPLSRPDILDLLFEVKRLGYKINLDTVGTPLLGEAETYFFGRNLVKHVPADKLAPLADLIGIPLDGPSSASIQTFREGRGNVFQEQLRILDALSQNNANVCVNTVVHKKNYEVVSDILPTILGFSAVKKWQCFQFMPIGPLGYKNRDMFTVSDAEFEKLKDNVLMLAKETKPNLSVEFKSSASRKGNYLLVDTDGISWIPSMSYGLVWDPINDANNGRTIVGNINNREDHPKILGAILSSRSHSVRPTRPIAQMDRCDIPPDIKVL